MSVSNETVKQLYNGNGVTTVFAIPFAFMSGDISRIKVYLIDISDLTNITVTLKTITTHYTLNSATAPTQVTMLSAPSASQRVLITRESPNTQQSTFSNGAFLPADLEKALDRAILQIQELQERLDRAPQVYKGASTSFSGELPSAGFTAGATVILNADLTGFDFGPSTTEILAAQTAAEAAQAAAEAAQAAAETAETNAETAETNAEASETAAAASETDAEAARDAAQAAQVAAEVAQAAAEAAVASVIHTVVGSAAAPILITAAGGIPFTSTSYFTTIFVAGDGVPVDIVANPQIQAGTIKGQRLLLVPVSPTNTITLQNGDGVSLRGSNDEEVLFGDNPTELIWDESNWQQI